MPLTEQQEEEYANQVAALRYKITTCEKDIKTVLSHALSAQKDPNKINLTSARFLRAVEAKNSFIEAWDRIVLIHIKLGKLDTFPTKEESSWREKILDYFDQAQAIEISLKTETPSCSMTSHSESKKTLPLLDKIKLPHFDGEVRSWAKFRDVFLSMVDKDPMLDPVTKLYLLRDSLSGEALSAINKFDVTDANYPLAWKALTDTYENARVLASAYLENIFSFKMKPKPNLSEFQRFLGEVADNTSAFKALKLKETEDKILALAMLRTLDTQTRRKFELHQIGTVFPTTDDIVNFVRNQCQALKLSGSDQTDSSTNSSNGPSSKNASSKYSRYPLRSSPRFNTKSYHVSSSPQRDSCFVSRRLSPKPKNWDARTHRSNQLACSFCQKDHILARCPTFIGLPVGDRHNFTLKWKGCSNCLNPEHKTQECRSRWNCRFCQKRHHSLLHREPKSDSTTNEVQAVCGHCKNTETETEDDSNVLVILGTARAIIKDVNGRDHHVRLLLDSGSHRSFITRQCAESLRLQPTPTNTKVSGIGGGEVVEIHSQVRFSLGNQHGNNRLKMTAAVFPSKITSVLPTRTLPRRVVEYFHNYSLADPQFYQPQEIDILLGLDYYDRVVTGPFHRPQPDLPSVLPTIFGEVIMGPYKTPVNDNVTSLFCQPFQAITSQLQAFWELEEPPYQPNQAPEDLYCEQHYVKTHTRTPEGRYMVRLPFSSDPSHLGNNRAIASKRFFSLETKLEANKTLQQDYHHFMNEYSQLGHMEICKEPSRYIIPHFGVMQQKLRVVFDASCKSNTTSLNDIILPGPKLQLNVSEVLMQFRLFPVAITTDIVKMYRQILIHPDDRRYQHILWRENPDKNLEEHQLNTVTYGITSSPFHALRTIVQLINDEGAKYPLAVERLKKRIFVDDIATGADNEEEAISLCKELVQLFRCGGFSLSKWSSNLPSVIPSEFTPNVSPMSLQPEDVPEVKVLGLIWNPNGDTFSYVIRDFHEKLVTKRTVLSFISRIFDPLGFLGPVTFLAKHFMQQLWRNKLDWDDVLPSTLRERWLELTSSWRQLSHIKIQRYMNSRHAFCRLIGFCDASANGYAAVIYLQVQTSSCFETHMIAAKTKVSPAKFISISRLELCGAFLLSKLISNIDLPDVKVRQKILFTDSTVALGWIHTPSHLLSTFEANRVASISELSSDATWRHVRTKDNPADIASRGLLPNQIADSHIWWKGPPWLRHPPDRWPTSTGVQANVTLTEVKPMLNNKPSIDLSWMTRFSNLQLLLRTVVRILRFARRSNYKIHTLSDPIEPSELSRATHICARATQQQVYSKGPRTPELAALDPFLDELGVLRVGGRLTHSQLSFTAMHPIIIPKGSHLAMLIVHDIHTTYYHSGPTLTLAIIRSRFWIPSGLRFVKGQLKKCITCFRLKPTTQKAVMAPLPSHRLTPGRAFLETGIDYAGPFTIRDSLRRKPHLSKAYIALFICMVTKAIHLEAVTSLTTEAFLATLDRFVARRGKPNVIHSDNATNFVGASRYLKELMVSIVQHGDSITSHLARQGIQWRFIPPRSPHFGGLWEAGVKSVKSLLLTAVASQPFTYEELNTVLARVESILNSRPLCPLTDNPDDLDALTPGHFLIGSAITSLPEENLEQTPCNRLTRWQLVQRNVQHVWSRWRLEFLNTLQQRTKWRRKGENLQVGDLVVLIDKTAAYNHWPLARIIEVHPGPDGAVRVVTVKTSSGSLLKRSIHHLGLLPIPSSDSSP